MNYTPQVNDAIAREGKPPIIITKLTKATAAWTFEGDPTSQPRQFFDDLLAKTLEQGCTITRDGVQIHPPVVEEKSSGSHNTHARLAPSGSKTWSNCTASPAYVEANKHRIPEDSSSIYSEEGTTAHDYAADILLKNKTLADIPVDFQDPVGTYVDHCLSLVPDGVNYEVEVQVPLFYQADQTGTCDFAIVTDGRVTVRDYKHGAGVLVTSAHNPQLAIYAYSMIVFLSDLYDFTDDTLIDIKVVQPRHREADDDQAWVLPLSEFRNFCSALSEQAAIATEGVQAVQANLTPILKGVDDSYNPSEVLEAAVNTKIAFVPQEGDEGSCRWCKARGFCGARHKFNTANVTSGFLAVIPDVPKELSKASAAERLDFQVVTDTENPIIPKDGDTLRIEYLIAVFKNRKKIEKFLGDVEDYLESIARDTEVQGLKWVSGREGNRSWKSEDEAEVFCKNQKLLLEERCTIKLKSPTQIEAMLKEKLKNARTKSRFEQLVGRSEGRPVLVPADDKRPALAAPSEGFENLTEEEI